MTFLNQTFPKTRLRRLRSSTWIRDLTSETRLNTSDLILPLFIIEGQDLSEDVSSMPGVSRYSSDMVIKQIKKAKDLGIKAVALFPAIESNLKTDDGRESCKADNLICRTISQIKDSIDDIGIIADVALDPYTSHGHDGILIDGKVSNDETMDTLAEQALTLARAGADIVAPSDMMDGRVGTIRKSLEFHGFKDVAIMSYAAKYASAFYGPFRDAVGSAKALTGDKKGYQMSPSNSLEALREVEMDISEGADIIMIKPGIPYLDIVSKIKSKYGMPTFSYHVSGEFSMLKAASEKGWIDYDRCLIESLLAFKRAGCDGIFTYGALDAAKILNEN